MSALTIVAVGVYLGFLLITWNIDSSRANDRRAVWRRLARDRGAEAGEPRRGTLFEDQEGLVVDVEHVAVALDLSGGQKDLSTLARARFALGGGPRFTVREAGRLSAVGKALGAQDLELGIDAFDARFIVKGDDAAAIRRAWTDRAAELMSRLAGATVVSDGAEVRVSVRGAVANRHILSKMLDLAGELASVDARVLEPFAALKEAELKHDDHGWEHPSLPRVILQTAAGPAELTARYEDEGTTLALSLHPGREAPELDAVIRDGQIGGAVRGSVSTRVQDMVRGLEGATLTGGEQLIVSWPDVPAPDAVMTAAALLAELASPEPPSVGVFR